MSLQFMELRGSKAVELRRIDHILAELARPTLDQDSMLRSLRAAMVEVGIVVSGRPSRKDLVECVWGRKRWLLRQTGSVGDLSPQQPIARFANSAEYKLRGPRSLDG